MKNWSVPEACRYAVIGFPVAHSRSPQMQNAAFEACGLGAPYGKIEVAPEELADFAGWARTHLAGFNVTVPHKPAIRALCDEVSSLAQISDSVNTVTVRDGRLIGDTTDGYGLAKAIEAAFGVSVPDGRFVLLGAGGAAQAIACYLAGNGAREIAVVNRTIARAEALCERMRRTWPSVRVSAWGADEAGLGELLTGAEVTIQATSLGLKPGDALPVPPEAILGARAIFDTIYQQTPLGTLALQYDVPYACGAEMLLQQGAKSFEIWTGRAAPIARMRQALASA